MEDKINELMKTIGQPYEMFFEDGTYKGCFAPAYFLWPGEMKYNLPDINVKNPENYKYGIKQILKHFKRIDKKDVQVGDMVAGELNNELHVAILVDVNKIIHVTRTFNTKISRLSYLETIFTNLIYLRKK